jgi:hypothetical protein
MIDDSADDFFGLKTATPGQKAVGLVVGPRARYIKTPDGRVWDELADVIEPEYRRNGRLPVMFTHGEDEDGPERWPNDAPGEADAEARKWAAIMAWPGPGLPSVQDVERWRAMEWQRQNARRGPG